MSTRFEVFIAIKPLVVVFWVVMPYSAVSYHMTTQHHNPDDDL
jgi:hypothetical protein